ncbi:hypothetical protein F7725_002335, partial [Dissostichus mawsoni]
MSQSEQTENPEQQTLKSEHEQSLVLVNPKAVCNVCKRLYRDPKILPCLHTFCSDCIAQLEPFSLSSRSAEKREGDTVERQERATVTVLCGSPPSGPAGLSTDHLALDEVFLETLVTDGPLGCDLCGEGGAESRCEVCCFNLCEFCCQAHRRQKRTASHSVQSLQDLKSGGSLSRPVLCGLHPGQELRLFCQPCDLPVCLECAATLHRDHRCCPTQNVINRHEDSIRELVTVHLRPRMARLKDSLLKAHCLSLLRRLEELRVQRRNQLHLQQAQLQQALLDVGGSVEFAERLLSCGSDAEILSAKGEIDQPGREQLRPPASYCRPRRRQQHQLPVPGAGGEVGGFPVVGVIHAKTVDLSKCTIEGEGLQRGTEGEQGLFVLVCRDSAGEQLARGGEHVLVSIVHKEKKNCTMESTVVDNNDGSYSVSYTPEETGAYSVWVCVKAQHVKARCGCAGTMPGGFKGCGHGHKGHPGKPHWSCCSSFVEQSECLPQSVIAAISPTDTCAPWSSEEKRH